jgi:hypothetical protein
MPDMKVIARRQTKSAAPQSPAPGVDPAGTHGLNARGSPGRRMIGRWAPSSGDRSQCVRPQRPRLLPTRQDRVELAMITALVEGGKLTPLLDRIYPGWAPQTASGLNTTQAREWTKAPGRRSERPRRVPAELVATFKQRSASKCAANLAHQCTASYAHADERTTVPVGTAEGGQVVRLAHLLRLNPPDGCSSHIEWQPEGHRRL